MGFTSNRGEFGRILHDWAVPVTLAVAAAKAKENYFSENRLKQIKSLDCEGEKPRPVWY